MLLVLALQEKESMAERARGFFPEDVTASSFVFCGPVRKRVEETALLPLWRWPSSSPSSPHSHGDTYGADEKDEEGGDDGECGGAASPSEVRPSPTRGIYAQGTQK